MPKPTHIPHIPDPPGPARAGILADRENEAMKPAAQIAARRECNKNEFPCFFDGRSKVKKLRPYDK